MIPRKPLLRLLVALLPLVILLASLSTTSSAIDEGSIPPEELDALHALYNATNGANWIWEKGAVYGLEWNFTTTAAGSAPTPCLKGLVWQGLTCRCPTKTGDDSDSYCVITGLELNNFGLDGTIPPAIGYLAKLTTLDLSDNALTGSIPALDSLTALTNLYLNMNILSGNIPTLDSLINILELDLSNNALTGSVPSLSSLSKITEVLLSSNFLDSSLPSFDNLTEILYIYVDDNILSGSFPSLNTMEQIYYLFASNNAFTGSLPRLNGLPHLVGLSFASNRFSGTIEPFDGSAPLYFLYLSKNSLTGTLPPLNNLSLSVEIDFSNNLLQGTIPPMDSLGALADLYLYNNALTGSIPSLEHVPSLSEFQLYNNALSGSMPSLDSLSQLLFINVNQNVLTSSLPSLDYLQSLSYFEVSDNAFTGTIPSLETVKLLQILELSDNVFSGIIPSMTSLHHLVSVQAQNNKLSGSLSGIFNPPIQTQLITIQLSANRIESTIPAEIFSLPALLTFSMSTNCIRGPLPISSICNSTSLTTLLLDGLHTASSCRTPILSGLIPGLYTLDSKSLKLSDQLHPCLFSIPTLDTLQMSGNGLSSSIPHIIQTNISSLVLSYNALTGTIPYVLQKQQHWNTLDLSYNRLTGELIENFPSCFESNNESSISLQLNRLSGEVPSPLYNALDVTILIGNMFSCSIGGETLPVHEEDRRDYSCGSNAFNAPYYAWLVISSSLLLLLIGTIVFELKANSTPLNTQQIVDWFEARTTLRVDEYITEEERLGRTCSSSVYTNIQRVERLCGGLRRLVVNCCVYILIVLAPLYIICGLYSSTYTYRYAWTVSTSFLNSSLTAGLLFSALVVYVSLFVVQYNKQTLSMPATFHWQIATTQEPRNSAQSSRSVFQLIISEMSWLGVIIANICVIGSANIGFVYVSVYHGSRVNLFCVQAALATIKIAWNNKLLRTTINSLVSIACDTSSPVVAQRAVTLELYLAIFNNIVIPCLVVMVIDPDCYYTFLVPLQKVSAAYEYEEYVCAYNGALDYCHFTTKYATSSFSPPFRYSYQCSASFTTHYAAAFLFLSLGIGVVAPLAELLIIQLYARQLQKCSILLPAHCSQATTTLKTAVQSDTFSPILRSEHYSREAVVDTATLSTKTATVTTTTTATTSSSSSSTTTTTATTAISTTGWNRKDTFLNWAVSCGAVPRLLKPIPLSPQPSSSRSNNNEEEEEEEEDEDIPTTTTASAAADDDDYNPKTPFVNSTQYLSTIVVLLALLLTFGTVFPPLGLSIVATLVSYTYFTQFKIARFISLSKQAGLQKQLAHIDNECATFVLPPDHVVWALVTMACWFYAFILFDTLGDTKGLNSALVILCGMVLLPIIVYTGDRGLLWWYERHDCTDQEQRVRKETKEDKEAMEEGSTGNDGKAGGAVEMGNMTIL